MVVDKIGLRSCNYKRVVMSNLIDTLPPGHWKLKYENYDVPRYISSELMSLFEK